MVPQKNEENVFLQIVFHHIWIVFLNKKQIKCRLIKLQRFCGFEKGSCNEF